jgi:tellurite resistance protein TerC
LRSLYFLLANLVDRFIYLKTGLALILGFVGIKMIVVDYFPIPTWASLGVIVVVLATTIVASMIATQNRSRAAARK